MVFEIHRKVILTVMVLVSVLAFMPDTDHVGEDVVVHEVSDHSHESGSASDAETNHCHSGVSCVGAMTVKDFALLAYDWRYVETTTVIAKFAKDSLAPEHEAPVPILIS